MSPQTGQHAIILEVTDSEVNGASIYTSIPITNVSRHAIIAFAFPEVLQSLIKYE